MFNAAHRRIERNNVNLITQMLNIYCLTCENALDLYPMQLGSTVRRECFASVKISKRVYLRKGRFWRAGRRGCVDRCLDSEVQRHVMESVCPVEGYHPRWSRLQRLWFFATRSAKRHAKKMHLHPAVEVERTIESELRKANSSIKEIISSVSTAEVSMQSTPLCCVFLCQLLKRRCITVSCVHFFATTCSHTPQNILLYLFNHIGSFVILPL